MTTSREINTNIPSMNLKDFKETMLPTYEACIKNNIKFPALMLWGAPGVGKSDIIKQIANELSTHLKRKPNVVDVRLLLFNPVDLRGIPSADKNKENCVWLRPQIFQMSDSDDVLNFLVLDEITAAPQSVQAAAYQIVLDRKIGEHKLPDNCIIIAAGNRITDKSVSYSMPKALCNRMTHINIEPNTEAWKSWALDKGIDSRIIGFINWKGQSVLFDFDPSTQEQAYPTPRSWEMVDKYLKLGVKNVTPLIEGTIGVSTTNEFVAFCNTYSELPDITDILNGKYKDYPSQGRPDVYYALTSAIVDRVRNSTLEKEQVANLVAYLQGMQEEFVVLLLRDVVVDNNFCKQLVMCTEFVKLTEKYVKYIF